MIHILGGTARAGKSTAARRFTRSTGISSFSIDYLKMGLVRGLPEVGVDVYDDEGTAERLWPILRGMIRTYAEEEEDILLEGYYLLPDYVAEISSELGDLIRPCFLGFCEIAAADKVREMREHAPDGWAPRPGGWSDDDDAVRQIEHLKSVSCRIREKCVRHGFRYIDNNGNHSQALDEVVAYLTSST